MLRAARSAIALAGALMLASCASVLVPNPPHKRPAATASAPQPAGVARTSQVALPDTDTLDFADAFAEPSRAGRSRGPRGAHLEVPSGQARVLLMDRVKKAVLFASGEWDLFSRSGRSRGTAGTLAVRTARGPGYAAFVPERGSGREIELPCTLISRDPGLALGVDSTRYRGVLIVNAAAGGQSAFSVVNVVDVEEYLRGVVPAEIGRRAMSDIEAVKAQAIAARTYTYRKIVERVAEPYDLLPTVQDQVYAGLSGEDSVADAAVRATAGKVVVYDGRAIMAYYHSTCGGTTADPSQVWAKPGEPYLKPIEDRDQYGQAHCRESRSFSWNSTWKTERLAAILTKYAPGAACDGRFEGALKDIKVESRFACGRAEKVTARGSGGTAVLCGDRLRFALRREGADAPILPSARITAIKFERGTVRIEGNGYGHGVGLCQYGALGRSRSGQSCEDILRAYYTGAEIDNVQVFAAREAAPSR